MFSTILTKHEENRKPFHFSPLCSKRNKENIITTMKIYSRDPWLQTLRRLFRKFHYSGLNRPQKTQNRAKNRKKNPKIVCQNWTKGFTENRMRIVWPLGSLGHVIERWDHLCQRFESTAGLKWLASNGVYMPTRVKKWFSANTGRSLRLGRLWPYSIKS